MNDDVIADLKQFIAGAITQQTSDLRQDITSVKADITGIKDDITGIKEDIGIIKDDIRVLDQKVDDGFAAIAEILEDMHTGHDAHEAQLKDHAARITRLEQKTA